MDNNVIDNILPSIGYGKYWDIGCINVFNGEFLEYNVISDKAPDLPNENCQSFQSLVNYIRKQQAVPVPHIFGFKQKDKLTVEMVKKAYSHM